MKGKHNIRPGMEWEALLWALFLVLVTAGASWFVYLRGQDLNWDLLNYHFYTGYALLHGRYAYDIAAAGLQSFLHPATNVYAYLALRHLPFPFSSWSFLFIQLLSLPAIIMISRLLATALGYKKTTSGQVLAVCLCLLAPLWWSELGTSFSSSWLAPALLWGLYLLLRSFTITESQWALLFSGALFGFATGLKLTNAPFAVAAFVSAAMLYEGNGRLFFKKIAIFVVGGILGATLVSGWYFFLWMKWESPLFPFYNSIFKSPYYKEVNFRDLRWKFFSVKDFFSFVFYSAIGAVKTSEIRFADARIIIAILLGLATLPVVLFRKTTVNHGRQISAFLIFILVSFSLWACLFAYQRYLIPLELVLGLVIWVLLVLLIRQNSLRNLLMLGITLLSAYTIKIPDWGHAPIDTSARKPFSLTLPERLAGTPGRYLVIGSPVSYLLPYFHQDSVFYGLRFSPQSKAMIAQRLQEPSNLPIRVLASEHDMRGVWRYMHTFGYSELSYQFDCSYLSSAAGRYSVCDLVPRKRAVVSSGIVVDTAFADADIGQRKGVLWETGFSYPESWGRWTDGETARIKFQACLPKGPLRLSVTGLAYADQAGKPIRFRIGAQEISAVFTTSVENMSLFIVNDQPCADELTIVLTSSPSVDRDANPDSRRLGLGLTRIQIIKE